MKKPTKKHQVPEAFNWKELATYIEAKYGRELRDWNGRWDGRHTPAVTPSGAEIAYLDFWHWVVDHHEIHNGCFFTLRLRDTVFPDPIDGNAPRVPRCRCARCFQSAAPEGEEGWPEHRAAFAREVLSILDQEFPEENGELHVYTWW